MKKTAGLAEQKGKPNMSGKRRERKSRRQRYIAPVFFVLAGAACGLLIGVIGGEYLAAGAAEWPVLPVLLGIFLCMYGAGLVQLILHEAGHLVFGLLSGYRFCSFRIFSLMWVKQGGGIRLKRYSLAGTSGQCLMAPPDPVEGKIPVLLYNLGGVWMNLLTGGVFLGLFFLCRGVPVLSVVMLMLAAAGLLLAVVNGVPLRMGPVDNDGYNALTLTRSPEALSAYWIQMKVNEKTAEGLRLKDMPEEWFALPTDEGMKNSMTTAVGVLACNRLMDEGKFAEADRLMAHMLDIDSGMVGVHRGLLTCDRMYVELITENRRAVLDGMLTKEQRKFIKQMKNAPSVLRTAYAYALLQGKDPAAAAKYKAQFEARAKTSPYPGDIQSERELMELAEKKAGW